MTEESSTDDADQAMLPSEVARAFGVRPGTVVRWTDRGQLPCVKTSDGCRVYRRSDVRALIERLKTGRRSPASGSD